MKQGKRLTEIKKHIREELYDPKDAFDFLTKNSKSFESIDAVFVLGIDGRKSDQVVKGVVKNMPSGLGKKVSIGVFAKSDHKKLQEAGADCVGFEDLFAKVKNSEVDCDVYLATAEIMPELAKMGLGRILKGKMPNPKFGTVVEEERIFDAIKEQKAGQLAFRSNGSLVHCSIGRATFSSDELVANFDATLEVIKQSKPNVIKPHSYLKRIFVSSTMGPSIQLNFVNMK